MLDGSERRDRSRARVLLVACVSGDGNILNVTHPGFDSEHQAMLDRVPPWCVPLSPVWEIQGSAARMAERVNAPESMHGTSRDLF